MISLRRPSDVTLTTLADELADAAATFTGPIRATSGFRHDVRTRRLRDDTEFAAARHALQTWAAHRSAHVRVLPAAAPSLDATVALAIPILGVWILAACRITDVVDRDDAFGFTYVTLPGHPERGAESFTIRCADDGGVRFEIESVSRPAGPLLRSVAPLTRIVQARVTERYLDLDGLGRTRSAGANRDG